VLALSWTVASSNLYGPIEASFGLRVGGRTFFERSNTRYERFAFIQAVRGGVAFGLQQASWLTGNSFGHFPRGKCFVNTHYFLLTLLANCINVLVRMMFHIQSASGVPIYRQIELQVKHAIAGGELHQDAALPPVRKLATELRINPNTVARAYQNLERDGILRTVPGGGCFVSGQTPGLLKSEKIKRLKPLMTQLAVEAKQLRLQRDDVIRMLDGVYEELGGDF
jgi:GntR family transcriptional regulator